MAPTAIRSKAVISFLVHSQHVKWRQNNVEQTTMRRHDVASTLVRRCFKVVCLLGSLFGAAPIVCGEFVLFLWFVM